MLRDRRSIEGFMMRTSDDRGYALVTVALIGALAMLLVVVIFSRNSADFNRVSDDRRREQVLHGADAALDHALYWLDENPDWDTGLTSEPYDPLDFDSKLEEREWAIEEANYLADDNPASVVSAPDGEWVTVKPPNPNEVDRHPIFGVGFLPSRAEPRNIRVVKAEYDYAPFVPDFAVLTNDSLKIKGNAEILGAKGNVHANGDLVLEGSPYIDGHATASNEYKPAGYVGKPEESGGFQPLQPVPLVNPRENYSMSEYDLCPEDGKLHGGPAHATSPNITDTPCEGPELAEMRGWSYQGSDPSKGAMWRSGTDPGDGVYYIYLGSADIAASPGSSGNPWEVTLFAEASAAGEETDHCPHTGGDIVVSGSPNVRNAEGGYPLLFVAGRDLRPKGTLNSNSYFGVMGAHEQVSFSGNVKMNGVVIVNNYCDTPGSPVPKVGGEFVEITGNVEIFYDEGLDVPFGKTIRVTHWAEL